MYTVFHLKTSCENLPEVLSANVIGEIKGSEVPDEIVLVGGHLDSWDMGHGAHDDGAGVVQSLEALRILKSLGIKPKRTLRVVFFMNEECLVIGLIFFCKINLANASLQIKAKVIVF